MVVRTSKKKKTSQKNPLNTGIQLFRNIHTYRHTDTQLLLYINQDHDEDDCSRALAVCSDQLAAQTPQATQPIMVTGDDDFAGEDCLSKSSQVIDVFMSFQVPQKSPTNPSKPPSPPQVPPSSAGHWPAVPTQAA